MELTFDKKGFMIGFVFMLVAMGILYFCTTQVYNGDSGTSVAVSSTNQN